MKPIGLCNHGFPIEEDSIEGSHQYAAAIKILMGMPEAELKNQRCGVEELRQAGLGVMAQKLSQMSNKEYANFISSKIEGASHEASH